MQENNDVYMRLSKEMNEREFRKAYENEWVSPPPLPVTPSREHLILIVAGNYRQAQFFAKKHGIYPPYWHYINSPDEVLGFNGSVVYYGTFYQRRDIKEVMERVSSNTFLKVLDIDE